MKVYVLLLLAACASSIAAENAPVVPWQKPNAVAGRDLYRQNCTVCHDLDRDQKHTHKLGPSLNHLFMNPQLPLSHGKPSRAYVVVRIKFGGALMPAFSKQLTDPEINTLIDYIASK